MLHMSGKSGHALSPESRKAIADALVANSTPGDTMHGVLSPELMQALNEALHAKEFHIYVAAEAREKKE